MRLGVEQVAADKQCLSSALWCCEDVMGMREQNITHESLMMSLCRSIGRERRTESRGQRGSDGDDDDASLIRDKGAELSKKREGQKLARVRSRTVCESESEF